ncbi:MAG: polyprenol monophosphomannose synthase [Bacteroidetes bacterium]|nr:polyprenol monophosphomannose synthase [Bacteroidota bacterium]NCQ11034.1 polyprenol monophosphomannose synthase [Bacteroidota bacterium]
MTVYDTLVIIPTYNEIANMKKMIPIVMELDEKFALLVVDDGSPDGTATYVDEQKSVFPGRIHLLNRKKKLGLGTAYVAGFQYALDKNFPYICEMDADFSHDPNDLLRLVDGIRKGIADIVIGSRYCKGISIINWPLSRLILSYSANLYARFITGAKIMDMTAGFKCIRAEVLQKIDIKKIRSNGYAFQIEVHFRAYKAGFKIVEESIIFREREEGVSKMSKSIVKEAMWRVWSLKMRSLLNLL